MTRSISFIIIFCGIFFSDYAQPVFTKEDFNRLNSLAGTWKMNTSKGPLIEEWQNGGQEKLEGKSYRVSNGDTILLEQVTLHYAANEIFYTPRVRDQNNQQPIPFRLMKMDNQKFVFENRAHDFPQRIIYHLVTPDSIHARIEGKLQGKDRASDYYYGRLKNLP